MFGMTLEKVLVLLVLAALIIGPQRLPGYAGRLAGWIRAVRTLTESTRSRVEQEVGAPLTIEEWRALDPRQYDPRRILREALVAEPPVGGVGAVTGDGGPVGEAPATGGGRGAGGVTGAGGPTSGSPVGLDPRPSREQANRIAALAPGGWRPPAAASAGVASTATAPDGVAPVA